MRSKQTAQQTPGVKAEGHGVMGKGAGNRDLPHASLRPTWPPRRQLARTRGL